MTATTPASAHKAKATFFHIFLEFSVPLILGVVTALSWANLDPASYAAMIHFKPIQGLKFLHYPVDLHFLVNDVFMVLFFAIAAVEITRAFQAGGALASPKNAVNPLFGTIGGVLGPVGVFFALIYLLPLETVLSGGVTHNMVINGWGIPTATDIALAWLAASLILGKRHPAIAFLLLLAIVDDAIGLVIIAVFYPAAEFPVVPIFLLLNVLAMFIAYGLRKRHVHNIWAYIIFAGLPSWLGLLLANLHPALAFVVIIPFLPDTLPEHRKVAAVTGRGVFTPSLTKFERVFEVPVGLGLFFFGIVNAGVGFGTINTLTWIIFFSLFIGKAIGIFGFSALAVRLGYPLASGINYRVLLVIGLIAGMGLTVALFITGEAYSLPALRDPAKMGALFSALLGVLAWGFARFFKLQRMT